MNFSTSDCRPFIEEFVQNKSDDGREKSTCKYYMNELTWAANWAEKKNVALVLATEDELRDYFTSLAATRNLNSIHTSYRALRAWYLWLLEDKVITENPLEKIKRSLEHKQKRTYSPSDVDKLIEAAKDGKNPLRDQLIVTILLETGIRRGELAGVKPEDFEDMRLIVYGKGRRERILPVSSVTMKALRRYMMRERPGDGDDELILTQEGSKMSGDAIKRVLLRLAKRAKVSNVYAHRFRHTYATVMAGEVNNAAILQSLLGHQSIQTSVGYVNASDVREGVSGISVMKLMEKKRK